MFNSLIRQSFDIFEKGKPNFVIRKIFTFSILLKTNFKLNDLSYEEITDLLMTTDHQKK